MPKSGNKPKSEYAIQTVANALRMLEVFNDESEMGVSDLARRLDLHKNNAFRLLATLEIGGYIQQDPSTELYRLGPRCLELGHAFARSHTLMKEARPILQELADDVGETAHLGVLSGHQVVHLDGVLPSQIVLTALRIGERLDAHCTALGKVLLSGSLADRAAASEGGGHEGEGSHAARSLAIDSALAGGKLVRHTEATLDDPSKLVDELRAVGLRGYATDVDEYAVGLRCVAAPVRNSSARVVAALSLSGPSLRLDEERLHGEAAEAITEAATRLSSRLGSPV